MPRTLALLLIFSLTTTARAQDIPLSKILVDNDPWRLVAKDLKKVSYLDGEPNGDIAIYAGERTALLRLGGKVEMIPLPPFITPKRDATTARSKLGVEYTIAKDGKSVTLTLGKKTTPLKLPGLTAPTCLTLWPDEGHLVIGEADGAYLWAVRIEKDGSFGPGDRYYSLRTTPNEKLRVAALTMDANYLLYACTPMGVQVFDPTGRLSGVIPAPSKAPLSAITIGGAKADELFVLAGTEMYARRIQFKASYTLKKEK